MRLYYKENVVMNLSQEEKKILNQIVKITFKGNVVLENKNSQKK